MAETRTVQQGDHLSSIAAEEGFANFHTILDHPDNADLASKRDAHVLHPGDQLTIPDREDRTEFRPTDDVHTFQTDLLPLYLRCDILDIDRKPISAANCNLKVDSADVPDVVTDGKGIFIQPIGRQDKTATIKVHLPARKPPKPCPGDPPPPPATDPPPDPPPEETLDFDVKIGHLNPESKLSGQQARLNNLGYFAGFTVKDLDQLLWAAEEFECENLKSKVTRITTRPHIVQAQPDEQDDPAQDPKPPTGVVDAAFVKTLAKVHGI